MVHEMYILWERAIQYVEWSKEYLMFSDLKDGKTSMSELMCAHIKFITIVTFLI